MKLLFIIVLLSFFYGCKFNHPNADVPCDRKGGTSFSLTKGRVYQSQDKSFYFIGNIDSLRASGGYIACNGIPVEFQKEGLLIEYSGVDKGPLSDTGDPLYSYIVLNKIEKVE